MGGVAPVRRPLTVSERPRRGLDERALLRFPALAAATGALVARLSPRSRVRQASLRRSAQLTVSAYNRRDLDAVLTTCHPDVEYVPARELVENGLTQPLYRGRDGYRAYVRDTEEVWGADTRLEPIELVDAGHAAVLLATAPMLAQASGVPITLTFGLVGFLRRGLVERYEEFHDHGEALRAAGVEG